VEGEGPDAVLRGRLQIEDGNGFARLVARGIGRHRAFGFGMLLLMPPGRLVAGR
jgi:CRISPR system Cascade subunit CasE